MAQSELPLKILILKPSSLGDVVQALPVLRLLKRHLPPAKFIGGSIRRWRHCWKAIRTWPASSLSNATAGLRRMHWPELWRTVRWMRAQAFDWVIDLQCLARSGAFAWLANGKLARRPRRTARRRTRLLRHHRPPPVLPHPRGGLVLAGAAATRRAGGTGISTWLPERPAVAAAVREKWTADGARWLALQPGARWVK